MTADAACAWTLFAAWCLAWLLAWLTPRPSAFDWRAFVRKGR